MTKQLRWKMMEILISTYGRFNRKTLEQMFDLQTVQVSKDVNEYMVLHPESIVYDKSKRHYVPGPAFVRHF